MGRAEYDAAWAELVAAGEENTTVDASAKALFVVLAGQLEAAANDPAAIRALAAKLRTDNADLAASVTANTPAAPTP